ncbi:transcription initiation factor IIB [Entophlyctis luteolus]|nr:transcription initiation factor IIB [Entophlyctis luteolus]
MSNLNVKIMCSHCRNPVPNIVESFRDGDQICGDCGLVLGDRIVDTRSEWRTFSNSDSDGGDDPSRVGVRCLLPLAEVQHPAAPFSVLAAADTLLGDANTLEATSISRKDGGTGRGKDLARVHGKLSEQKKANALLASAKQISAMSERIGLTKVVTESAIQLYRWSLSNKQLSSKPQEGIMAACIFLACRQHYVSRTFKEICGLTNVPKKEIGKLFKIIQHQYSKENKEQGRETTRTQATPESFIRRFTGDLELDNAVRLACVQVGNRVYQNDILGGRSTISLAASVIYFVVCMSDSPKSAIEIAKISGCTESTLKTSYKILYQHREELIQGIQTAKGLEALPTITNTASVNTATDWLSAHDWNVEAAIQNFYSEAANDGSNVVDDSSSTATPRMRRKERKTRPREPPAAQPAGGTGTDWRPWRSIAGLGLGIGRRFGTGSAPMVCSCNPCEAADVRHAVQTLLQKLFYPVTLSLRIVWFLVSFAASVFPFNLIFPSVAARVAQQASRTHRDPQAAAARFLLDYESKHGTSHPAFFQGSYSQALEIAKRELRCLLVLLYSAEHADMVPFCDATMADDRVLDLLREKRVVVWAGDLRDSEASAVATSLLAAAYPFLAIIAPQGNARMALVQRFQGNTSPETLVAELQRHLRRVDTVLRAARLERDRIDQARILREQQDEAYNASLRADQEKARLAQEELERLEREKLEEETRTIELQRKREVDIAGRFEKSKRLRKAWLQENMVPEPPAHEIEDVAKVGIRLPNGVRLVRRFQASTATDLYDFIEAQDLTPLDLEVDFEVINTYPRKALLDKTISVREAGLYPTSSLVVEEV